MGFTPRLTRPVAGNKYYITTAKGGYSKAITGKVKSTGKADTLCNVLSNCVGYAYGRFNEIGGYNSCKYLYPVNAEDFPEYRGSLTMGNEPKVGAVIVWKKGALKNSKDGAGHVAVVEKVYDDGSILISQSGYNSTVFWTATHKKGSSGNWTEGSDYSWMKENYTFRGFIYNPAVKENIITYSTLKKGMKSDLVKDMQKQLFNVGYNIDIDGSFGPGTEAAVKSFQTANKLTCDGIAGEATRTLLAKLSALPEGVIDLHFKLNNKDVSGWCIEKNDQNYLRVADFVQIGLAKSVTYNSATKQVEVKTQ